MQERVTGYEEGLYKSDEVYMYNWICIGCERKCE